MYTILLFLIGFLFLFKSAELLVEGACCLAKRLKISDLAIGLTVVAFGTSLPELFVNIIASISGDADIAIGNILGSNIVNIFLILGISAIIFPLSVTKGTVWKEIPFALLAVILAGIMANDHWIGNPAFSVLTRIDGLILLAFFVIFLYYVSGIAKEIPGLREQLHPKELTMSKTLILITISLIGLWIGSRWVVEGAVYVASLLSLSQSFIGLTIIAVGTSLPEFATSIVAAYKKKSEIAVGNVVGSNIFNIFFILGISSVIRPLPFNKALNIDIGITILASFLLLLCMFTGKKHKLDRWEGVVFIVLYIGYIAFLVMRG